MIRNVDLGQEILIWMECKSYVFGSALLIFTLLTFISIDYGMNWAWKRCLWRFTRVCCDGGCCGGGGGCDTGVGKFHSKAIISGWDKSYIQ